MMTRALLLLMLGLSTLLSPAAWAESIPSTSQQVVIDDGIDGVYFAETDINYVLRDFPSPEEACITKLAAFTPWCGYATGRISGSCWINSYGYWTCPYTYEGMGCDGYGTHTKVGEMPISRRSGCLPGWTQQNGQCVKLELQHSCPELGGWTLSADELTCSRPDCEEGTYRDPQTGLCPLEKGLGEACRGH